MCNTAKILFLFVFFIVLWEMSDVSAQSYGSREAILLEEFIFESAPFPSCHASSVVETGKGTILATWFGGYYEKHKRVGIWTSRRENGRWTPPVEAANGLQPNGEFLPCWNPVLFQPQDGPLTLYFKVGPDPRNWWGEMMVSDDDGLTWKNRRKLPENGIGPVRCKPVEITPGRILCPSSNEEGNLWLSHMEYTNSQGTHWERGKPLHTVEQAQTIQPTLMPFADGRVLMFCRDRNSNGTIWQSWSEDRGETWGPFSPSPLPNPGSGVDGLTLHDGRLLLIYNHTNSKPLYSDAPTGRSMLNLALSNDGKQWLAACIFENTPDAEFSYPAIIQAKDGLVHITYTWKRQLIKYVVLDPKKIHALPIKDGHWPDK